MPTSPTTLSLIGDVGYAGAYLFKYSPRPGTPGADMEEQVDEVVKSERLHRLQAAVDRSQTIFNRGYLGRTLPVLFERPARHAGQIVGRSPYLQLVQIDAPASLLGAIADVTITDMARNSLFGALKQNSSPRHFTRAGTRRHRSLNANDRCRIDRRTE